ncbi:MAG: hypothetical protein KA509_04295 [Flavobacterium sp.]|nr:hypothetical protein [Flavobacterium sp.]
MSILLYPLTKQQKQGLALWIAIVTLFYFFHELIFASMEISTDDFSYSLLSLYLFFGIFSMALMLVLFQVRSRNFDLLGMSFLIVTTVKMMTCFFFVRPIFKSVSVTAPVEKINFFVMFIVFLAIETLVAIRILNEKQ